MNMWTFLPLSPYLPHTQLLQPLSYSVSEFDIFLKIPHINDTMKYLSFKKIFLRP